MIRVLCMVLESPVTTDFAQRHALFINTCRQYDGENVDNSKKGD